MREMRREPEVAEEKVPAEECFDGPGRVYVPKEETFPFPLKYIDVMRSTCTYLDVAQEKRIDDYWNVDEDRRLSDSWTGFTKFT